MKELWNSIVSIYENYRGSGKIIVLFIVSVLIIYLFNNSKENKETGIDVEINPGLFLLSVHAGIAYAFSCVYNWLKVKRIQSVYCIITCVLIFLTIIMSGTRVFSADKFVLTENSMHIPNKYKQVMDRILAQNDDYCKIIAAPELNKFFEMYNPMLDTFYDYPANGDTSLMDSDELYVYEQMQLSTPDENGIIRRMREYGCNYIVYDSNSNYFELALEEYGLILVDTVDDIKIYKYLGGSE